MTADVKKIYRIQHQSKLKNGTDPISLESIGYLVSK